VSSALASFYLFGLVLGGAIIIPVSAAANPINAIGVFGAQNPLWYGRGANEIQQSQLDNLFVLNGRNYGMVNSYYSSIYNSWSDYIYITPTSIKLVKGPFTTSANSYVQVTTLASFAPGTNPINFDVNAGDLNNSVAFTQLYYNVFTLDNNGLIKDLLEGNPSPIVMQSTFTRTETDSDPLLGTPAADDIQTVRVQVQ
jgi:hypothetical protein